MANSSWRNVVIPFPGSQVRRTASSLLQKRDALHACDLKSLAAAHVLAAHPVVATQHVGLRLGKLGPVALLGPRGQTLLLGP